LQHSKADQVMEETVMIFDIKHVHIIHGCRFNLICRSDKKFDHRSISLEHLICFLSR